MELDFQALYGIDLSGHVRTPDGWVRVMDARSSRWFVWRVLGLAGMTGSRWAAWLKRNETEQAAQVAAAEDDDDPDRMI